MIQAAEWKSRLICYISLICEKIHKVWFKILWNWFNDIWPFGPSPGPMGEGNQKMVPLHMPYLIVTHTPNLVELQKKKFFDPQWYPWRMTEAAKWKSRLICFISFICEKTHKVWFKNLWNWLSNWNLMIFNDIWPFGHWGGAKKKCLHAPFMWATHTPNLVGFPPMV